MGTPAIILDRDGVINENRSDHVKCWEEFQFLHGALQALRRLSDLGLPIVVVTNQAIVGRGIVTQDVVDDIHRRMLSEIRRAGARIDEVFCCPHAWDEQCDCRKPQPGMLLDAAQRLGLELERSVFVGDALTDIEAGKAVNCKTILVRTGRGEASLRALSDNLNAIPNAIERNLLHALPTITGFLGFDAPPSMDTYEPAHLLVP